MIHWKAPPEGWLKVNTDAAVFPGRQRIGIGIVVRDWLGNIVLARQCSMFGCYSPRLAEIMGIREALSWLKGEDNIIVESDTMDVIREIRNPSIVELEMLVEDCLELIKQFDNICFIFVGRCANQAAHVLAQYVSSISGHQEWACHFPEFLTTVTASDMI
ncbi:uncharacterized protein LOC126672917 [Mercurialis annua]|uniref:uncharacterized protein LOC126672917 n=1 Tax=Mercurialis annua TaxID=3986 RepID=UPI00215E8A68|nr:uncharacterized protein LOC126672917 [Mercurialis annua]